MTLSDIETPAVVIDVDICKSRSIAPSPADCAPCINLHDSVYIVSGETVVDPWKVAARGKVA